MPLEKTLACCDLLEGRVGKGDIFCKMTVSSIEIILLAA